MPDVRPAASSLNADLYFAGPRAAEAHLGTAGCHVRFLNFPRRRGCLSDHRRSLRSYFTMTRIIVRMLKQKPRNSSCVSIVVSIKNRQLLALMTQGSADRRGSTLPHTRRGAKHPGRSFSDDDASDVSVSTSLAVLSFEVAEDSGHESAECFRAVLLVLGRS